MNKEIFDIVRQYSSLENTLYFKLEELGLKSDLIEELLEGFNDLEDKILKVGKYIDNDMVINKETYLIKQYEEVERYIKVNVIYECDNDMNLCETTAGSLHLIPKEYLAEY